MMFMRGIMHRGLAVDDGHHTSNILITIAVFIFLGILVYTIRKIVIFVLECCNIVEKRDDTIGASTIVID